jgi:hypothetical protein
VPVKGSSLDGVDSLYSIVQMPVSWTLFRHVLPNIVLCFFKTEEFIL